VSARDRVIVGVALGRWQTNCYIVGEREHGRAVVIDPGETGAARVPDLLTSLDLRCEAILLTHAHLDHLWAAPDLARRLDVGVHLHPADRWLWDDPAAGLGLPAEMLSAQFGFDWDPPDDRLVDLTAGQRLTLGGTDFDVRHNPGHTPGHVTFLGRDLADAQVAVDLGDPAPAAYVLFSGDLVFAGSVGRVDLPGGSASDMQRSLAGTVLPLEDATVILSGHGPDTTVGRERATNPFLQQLTPHDAS